LLSYRSSTISKAIVITRFIAFLANERKTSSRGDAFYVEVSCRNSEDGDIDWTYQAFPQLTKDSHVDNDVWWLAQVVTPALLHMAETVQNQVDLYLQKLGRDPTCITSSEQIKEPAKSTGLIPSSCRHYFNLESEQQASYWGGMTSPSKLPHPGLPKVPKGKRLSITKEGNPFSCSGCTGSFSTISDRKRHWRYACAGNKSRVTFKCPSCSRLFSRQDAMKCKIV
jgi:hypothetical protein